MRNKMNFTPTMYSVFTLLLLNSLLFCFPVPYSETEVKSDSNLIQDFQRTLPKDFAPIPYRTQAWVWHNKSNLFVLCESEIDSTFIQGQYNARDKMSRMDCVRIFLNTNVESYSTYQFYGLPKGGLVDGVMLEDGSIDLTWNSQYQTKNEIIQKDGRSIWLCRFTIPFADLRLNSNPPYHWKLILGRLLAQSNEFYHSPPLTMKDGRDFYRKAIDLDIETDASIPLRYSITPHVIYTYDAMKEKGQLNDKNVGIDAVTTIGANSNVKIAINPDFSDVPLDSEENVYNSKYRVSLSENRAFFSEDIDAFGLGSTYFDSRNIQKPQWAIKATGASSHLIWGLLAAQDTPNNDVSPSIQDDKFFILGLRPFNDKIKLQCDGLLRQNSDFYNLVLYFSPSYEFKKNNILEASYSHSLFHLASPDTNYTGDEYYLSYYGTQGDWNWYGQYTNVSEHYLPYMGTYYDTGIYRVTADVNYTTQWDHIKSLTCDFYTSGSYFKTDDHINDRLGSIKATLTDLNNRAVSLRAVWTDTYYWGSVYSGQSAELTLSDDYLSWLSLKSTTSIAKTLVYKLFKVHDLHSTKLQASALIGANFSVDGNYSFNRYFAPAIPNFDPQYAIANISLRYNVSNKIQLTGGVRFKDNLSGYIGAYTNCRWEYANQSYIDLGYRNTQYEYENSWKDGEKSGYCKVSYQF